MHRFDRACLSRRSHVFWIRKAVPVELAASLGKTDVRRSLRTSSPLVARQRARTALVVIEEAFETLRAVGLPPQGRAALEAILTQMMDDFDRCGVRWAERLKYRAMLEFLAKPDQIRTDARFMGSDDASLERGAYPAQPSTLTDPDSINALAKQSPTPPTVGDTIREVIRDELERINIQPGSNVLFSALVETYLDHKAATIDSKHLRDTRMRLGVFLKIVGDKEIRHYTRQDMLNFVQVVAQIPYKFSQKFKTDDPFVAIELNKKRKTPEPTIKQGTIEDKYLSPIKTMFSWFVVNGWIDFDVTKKIGYEDHDAKRIGLQDVEVRLPFEAAHLAQLRENSNAYARNSIDYWWIRIQPRSSLRLGEVAQLEVCDIREIHGRPCIDLLHVEDGDPIRRARRADLDLKTLTSRRIIPIPQALIDDGLLEYVEKRRRRDGPRAALFPRCKPDRDGHYSADSKRIARQIDRVIDDPRYVDHSCRHNFAAACDQAHVPGPVRDMFMGHASGNKDVSRRSDAVRRRYGSPIPSPEQMAWIDRVRF